MAQVERHKEQTGANLISYATLLFFGLVLAVLVLMPLGFLLWGTFQSATPGTAEARFTFANWANAYGSFRYVKALSNTLQISAFVTILALINGGLMAWLVVRTDMPWRRTLEVLLLMPMFLSPFTGAVAWVALLAPRSGLLNDLTVKLLGTPLFNAFTMPAIVFVMFLFYTPYVYLFTASAIRQMDPSYEEACQMVGASRWATAWKVTVPLAMPALGAAGILVFVLSAEMFSIPGMMGIPGQIVTLPYEVYSNFRSSPPSYPMGATLGTVLLLFTVGGMLLHNRMTAQSKKFVTVTARGFRSRDVRLGNWGWVAVGYCLLYIFLAVVLPYAVLITGSFMKTAVWSLSPENLTLDNWKYVQSAIFKRGFMNTLMISGMGALGIVLLTPGISWLVVRSKLPGRRALDLIGTLPVAVPGLVLAVGMIWAYVRLPLPIYGTIWIMVLAFLTKNLPYGLRVTNATLIQIDPQLEESARTCGATPLETYRAIVLPLLQPALMYVFIFTFIVMVREISASVMLYTSKSVLLSVLQWDLMEDGRMSRAFVVGLVQAGMIMTVIFGARYFFGVNVVQNEKE